MSNLAEEIDFIKRVINIFPQERISNFLWGQFISEITQTTITDVRIKQHCVQILTIILMSKFRFCYC